LSHAAPHFTASSLQQFFRVHCPGWIERMSLRKLWRLVVDVFGAWSEDRAQRMGAALAYYSVFSLAPLLVLAIAIGSLAFDRDVTRTAMLREIQNTIGEPAASALDAMMKNVQGHNHRSWAAVFGIAALLIGASGVFSELQDSLNTIWKVKPREGRGFLEILRERFLSFAVVLGSGFLLLVSLVVTALLSALGDWAANSLPGGATLWKIVNSAVSFASITFLFALIFKLLPDVRIPWRPVWIGAAVTALLFTLGKFAIGAYLGQSAVSTVFGAAASLVIILVWVYYASQIVLLGAELTRMLVLRHGDRVQVEGYAKPVSEADRVRQGMEPVSVQG
jgi:membrane protein